MHRRVDVNLLSFPVKHRLALRAYFSRAPIASEVRITSPAETVYAGSNEFPVGARFDEFVLPKMHLVQYFFPPKRKSRAHHIFPAHEAHAAYRVDVDHRRRLAQFQSEIYFHKIKRRDNGIVPHDRYGGERS